MQERDRLNEEQPVGEEGCEEGGWGAGSLASQPDTRRQHWSDEENAWIIQEALRAGKTREEVAERHGVPSRRRSFWRKLARKGELVIAPAPQSEGSSASAT